MYDNGAHEDERADDDVWSFTATFSSGKRLCYVYTNSGKEGHWEGLDVPWIRSSTVEAKNNQDKVYRPIESFGQIYMKQILAWPILHWKCMDMFRLFQTEEDSEALEMHFTRQFAYFLEHQTNP